MTAIQVGYWQCKWEKAQAEIERLTALVDTLREQRSHSDDEIDRLRAVVSEAARRLIANGDGYGANEAARALEPKP